ncbi:MAG TPA: P-II family nitrogen regulator [Methanothrix sp.]|nr:P-II family nitrogen regulator [Methanothrix sp.]
MKMIQVIIRPSKVEDVKNALDQAGYVSLTSIEVKGRGRQKGITQMWRGEEYKVDMLPKVKVEIVVPDEKQDEVVELIRKAAYTGSIGDGKIFVLPVEKTIRIRTGETDGKAL